MKPIIVKQENASRIMQVIREVQKRTTARTIDDFSQIEYIINGVEHRIGRITKRALEGTTIIYDFRQHFPNRYKYKADSTFIVLVFLKGNWRMVNCGRGECPNINTCYPYELQLSDNAKQEILRRYK